MNVATLSGRFGEQEVAQQAAEATLQLARDTGSCWKQSHPWSRFHRTESRSGRGGCASLGTARRPRNDENRPIGCHER